MRIRSRTLLFAPRICSRLSDLTLRSKSTLSVSPSPLVVENIDPSCADFRFLKEHNCKLVDKTQSIFENILSASVKYNFIVRPRRFGKSLMCSTVKEAYGGEKARDLFSDTWLGTCGKWDFAARSHPVIHLDMSSVAGPSNTVETFMYSHKGKDPTR